MTFRAFIDGTDDVYIQNAGGTIWYHHLWYQLPGYWNQPTPLPTYVDNVAWYPTWPWPGTTSDKYTNPVLHPTGEWTLTGMTANEGRSIVSVVQSPEASNEYTAIIELNDNNEGGAAWYQFTITWEAPSLFVAPEYWMGAFSGLMVCLVAFTSFAVVKKRQQLPI
jgi:hypothetical protein